MQSGRRGQVNVSGQTGEFLDAALSELRGIGPLENSADEHLADKVVNTIDNTLPLSNEICEVLRTDLQHWDNDKTPEHYRRFLERIFSLTESHEGWFAPTTWSLEHYSFFAQELFCRIIAICLSQERFDAARFFMESRYVTATQNLDGPRSKAYSSFSDYLEAVEAGGQRRSGSTNFHATLLRNRCSGAPRDFQEYMQADFCLYLERIFRGLKTLMATDRWWPTSLIFANRRDRAFEIFIRSESRSYANRVARMFGLDDATELQTRLEAIPENSDLSLKWSHWRLDVLSLSNSRNLGTFP